MRDSGFTLLEISIVILIIGLLLSGLLAPLSARIEQEERRNTAEQLDEIQQTLYGFALKNNHLPCPDCTNTSSDCSGFTANDGLEDRLSDTSCAAEMGDLPWATLGVKGRDAWGNIFTYRVSDIFADDIPGAMTGCLSGTPPPTQGVSFSLCSDGNITVLENVGTPPTILAEDIPAIVLSHGKNGSSPASFSADEMENSDNDGRFVDRDYSRSAADGFDDMLIWISPHVLRITFVKAGSLP